MNHKKNNQYSTEKYLSFSKKSYKNKDSVLYKRFVSIKNFLKNYKNKKIIKILDAGCGDGRLLNLLAKNNKVFCYGVEKNRQLIDSCKLFNKKNLIFLKDDIRSLKSIKNSSIDVAITLGTLNNIYRAKIIKSIKKKVKKGGYLILSAQNKFYDFTSFNYISKLFYKDLFSIKSQDLIEFNKRTSGFSNYINLDSFYGYDAKTIKDYKNLYKINPLTAKDFFKKFSLNLIKLEFYNPHKFNNIQIKNKISSYKKFFLCSGLLLFLKKNI